MGTRTVSDALPVYASKDVPDRLRTATQLKAQRLKPAEGQDPVALVRVYRRGHGWGEFPLYDPAHAAPMRALSPKQQAAMTARRTCPQCHGVGTEVVYRVCQECQEKEHRERLDLQARTCWHCCRPSDAPLPQDQDRLCVPCWLLRALRRQVEAARVAVWSRTCPGRDCQKVTSTDEGIAAARAAQTWRGPVWCPPCKARDERETVERLQAVREAHERAVEARGRRVAELVDWAGVMLADPDTVVLDTETTGLHNDARVVDVAVYSMAGETLLDTLVDPGEPIPADAAAIHGITDAEVTGAPSFSALLPQLTAVLEGRRCLIYNKPFDVGRLRHELTVHYRQAGHAEPEASAAAWLAAVRFEDVMLPYSEWAGDWSEFHGDYLWQPLLGGDHRALSDCRAVVDTLRAMAAGE